MGMGMGMVPSFPCRTGAGRHRGSLHLLVAATVVCGVVGNPQVVGVHVLARGHQTRAAAGQVLA